MTFNRGLYKQGDYALKGGEYKLWTNVRQWRIETDYIYSRLFVIIQKSIKIDTCLKCYPLPQLNPIPFRFVSFQYGFLVRLSSRNLSEFSLTISNTELKDECLLNALRAHIPACWRPFYDGWVRASWARFLIRRYLGNPFRKYVTL